MLGLPTPRKQSLQKRESILIEDAGTLGFGIRGGREFGRCHFSDLVAAFSSPWLLAVHHGALELGSVHPASPARSPGDASPILLLGGRSRKVTNVDWLRRRVSVHPRSSAVLSALSSGRRTAGDRLEFVDGH